MAKKKINIPHKYQIWVEVRRRYNLSHAHIQMARELGLNPKKFGGLANRKQEPWKAPLPLFIEKLYRKKFGKAEPEHVRSIEEMVEQQREKKKRRRLQKKQKEQELEE